MARFQLLHRRMEPDSSGDVIIAVPSRWQFRQLSRREAVAELDRLGGIISKGVEALHGVYMGLTDLIRDHGLSDGEVRSALAGKFPQPRISELIRVARAPNEVYRRYQCGFFGFKAALQECRGYQITPSEELHRRKIRRTAERLLHLVKGPATIEIAGHTIIVS